MTSLGADLKKCFRSVRESFFCKKAKTDVREKISQEEIVRLRLGKKDSVPFSKYFKTDQVFKTGSFGWIIEISHSFLGNMPQNEINEITKRVSLEQ